MIFALDLLRFILLSAVIGYAAYSDLRFGEVANKVWLYAPFGLCLTLLQLMFEPEYTSLALASAAAAILVSLALFYLGGWGGADTKAFLTIAVSLPLTPMAALGYLSMLPLNVILISSLIAFAAGTILHKKDIRFLPFVFTALFLALLL